VSGARHYFGPTTGSVTCASRSIRGNSNLEPTDRRLPYQKNLCGLTDYLTLTVQIRVHPLAAVLQRGDLARLLLAQFAASVLRGSMSSQPKQTRSARPFPSVIAISRFLHLEQRLKSMDRLQSALPARLIYEIVAYKRYLSRKQPLPEYIRY
jgi:hypothetical protein